MNKEIISINLRLPVNIHKNIKNLAELDDRSLNNYIIKVLESHIKEKSPKE